MRCDDCTKHHGEGASQGYPYPTEWCSAGHWDGGPPLDPNEPDPWKDCADFETNWEPLPENDGPVISPVPEDGWDYGNQISPTPEDGHRDGYDVYRK